MPRPICICGECEICLYRQYRQTLRIGLNRGNDKWNSERRMPWPAEYFEVEEHSGSSLSRPEESQPKIHRTPYVV